MTAVTDGFNEMSLRADIAAKWGHYGAHVDVFDFMVNEIRSLRQDLVTAHLMAASDATDAPGVISHVIRPFLEGALDRHGIDLADSGSDCSGSET